MGTTKIHHWRIYAIETTIFFGFGLSIGLMSHAIVENIFFINYGY